MDSRLLIIFVWETDCSSLVKVVVFKLFFLGRGWKILDKIAKRVIVIIIDIALLPNPFFFIVHINLISTTSQFASLLL